MKLLAAAGDIDALIAHIRLRTPLELLARQRGWSLQVRSFHDCGRADLAAADVLVVQRGTSARAWRLQEAMRQRGAAVVYEIDDLLTELPAHISNQAAVQAALPWLRRCLANADVVSVSTERLGQELGHEVGLMEPLCVPNAAWPVGDVPLPAQGPPQPGQPVSLLFASMERLAGGFMHAALRALQGQDVQIVAVGPAAQGFIDAGLQVRAQPLLPREQFIQFARALPNPAAVIPLEDSRFGACKSAIKWFDYAEAGIPVWCSTVSPYTDVVEHGVTGCLVANDEAAWLQALQQAVANPAGRQRLAAAARLQVRRQHTQQHMVDAWQQALEAALQRRAQTQLQAPTWAWRAQEALGAVLEGPALHLRRFNRERLEKREAKRAAQRQQARR